ncbi:MAG: flagellar hook-associated protein 3 FlgL [Candidatus Atribacteria bacterium]|nr:flagellar hook-associated protein 3 FlgL [Candidatus Atribacteria bacterium]
MRVTQKILSDRVMNNLNSVISRTVEIQDMLSSGKAVRRPSDDPVRINHILDLKTSIGKLEQYQSNVEDAVSWLNLVDTTLDNATLTLQKIRTLAVEGANGSLTASDREIIAVEVEQYLGELIGVANTAYGDKFLFSGTEVKRSPFSLEGEKIKYWGNNQPIIREIESKTTMAIGFPGDEFFFRGAEASSEDMSAVDFSTYSGQSFTINGENISIDASISNLQDLVNAINNHPDLKDQAYATTDGSRLILRSRTEDPLSLFGTPLESWGVIDTTGTILHSRPAEGILKTVQELVGYLRADQPGQISTQSLADLDQGLEKLLQVRSQVGARTLRLENALNRFGDFSTNMKELLSLSEDIDVAQVVMELKEQQNVYQMALAAAAQIIQPTLLDFLR